MILPIIVATFFGYVETPVRKFFDYYIAISLLILLSVSSIRAEGSEGSWIASLFLPAYPTLALHYFLYPFPDLNPTITNLILLCAFEIPIIFTCFHLGRHLAAKTGHIHRL